MPSSGQPLSDLAGNCPACARVARAIPGQDPLLIADLQETVVILHKHQRYAGWCTLWLKDHAEHLGLLPRARQERIAAEVSRVARAMHRAMDTAAPPTAAGSLLPAGPIRINYECLGNVVPHVHWHLIPRRANDPDPRATIWVRPTAETDCGCDDATRDRLVGAIRAALASEPVP